MQPVDRAKLIEFLELFSGGGPGQLLLFTLPDRRHYHFDHQDVVGAASFIISHSENRGTIYIRSNIQENVLGTTTETVAALTVLTLDFDIKGSGHIEQKLPTSADEFDVIRQEAKLPEPTVVLNTGGGLFAAWALDVPFEISGPDERDQAKSLSQEFQRCFTSVAAGHGYKLDTTSDLVRCCRIPFTTNWKTAYGPDGADVTVRNWPGTRYTIEQINEHIRSSPSAGLKAKVHKSGLKKASPCAPVNRGFEAICNGCAAGLRT